MQQWIQHTLSANLHGFAVLPAAFLLGLLGALSSCCTLPVVGAMAGYAGTIGGRPDRRRLLLVGVSLMIGTALSLAVVGAVTGFVGQVAGATLGRYWRFAGGLVMVLFGLSTLRLLNIRVPKIEIGKRAWGGGFDAAGGPAPDGGRSDQAESVSAGSAAPTGGAAGAVVYGLAVGGATTACSVCCNPVLPVAVGAVAMKGAPILGAAILAVFALGYSLPLAAGMVGLGFGLGRLGLVARRIMPAVRIGFGVLLIGVGFYLLAKG